MLFQGLPGDPGINGTDGTPGLTGMPGKKVSSIYLTSNHMMSLLHHSVFVDRVR